MDEKLIYKSSGPLLANNIILWVYLEKSDKPLVTIQLSNKVDPKTLEDNIELDSFIDPKESIELYRYLQYTIALDAISVEDLYDWIEKIGYYRVTLKTEFEPSHKDDEQLFYKTYIWIKEDLERFCLFSGTKLKIQTIGYEGIKDIEEIDRAIRYDNSTDKN